MLKDAFEARRRALDDSGQDKAAQLAALTCDVKFKSLMSKHEDTISTVLVPSPVGFYVQGDNSTSKVGCGGSGTTVSVDSLLPPPPPPPLLSSSRPACAARRAQALSAAPAPRGALLACTLAGLRLAALLGRAACALLLLRGACGGASAAAP